MAHRLLANLSRVFITSAKVFGTSFTNAYKQAAVASAARQTSVYAQNENLSKAQKKLNDLSIDFDESCQILDIDPTKEEQLSPDHIDERYNLLFGINSKENGGSFYLQSKIYRAMERLKVDLEIKQEIKKEQQKAQQPSQNPPQDIHQ